MSSRTFCVFISTTYSDLVAERNTIQEQFLPYLRQPAQQRGCCFQPIDLRWELSKEAALDQQTMKICLDQIERRSHLNEND